METIEKFISILTKDSRVLDVGCYGHEGVNTSQYLASYFDHVTGVAISTKVKQYLAPNYELIQDNFYDHDFENKQYDLVIMDMPIEGNLLNDWNEKQLEKMQKLVAPGGFLVNYVMMTDQYGDPDITPDLIRFHSQKFWGVNIPTLQAVGDKLKTIKGWKKWLAVPEERREYILWTMLRKTDGLSSKTEESSSPLETPTKPTPSSSMESSSLNSTTTTKVSSPSKTKKVKTK